MVRRTVSEDGTRLLGLRYARTRSGTVVHVLHCPYARTGIEWKWAEGRTLDQLDTELRALGVGYRCCLRCLGYTWHVTLGGEQP